MFRKKILFVNPDYHCSFLLRDEFRKLAWRADVYISSSYPEKLLYKDEGLRQKDLEGIRDKWVRRFVSYMLWCFYLIFVLVRYKYFLFYRGMDALPFPGDKILKRFLGQDFRLPLSLAKLLGKKLLYLPSGCLDIETKANFSRFDNGNICSNCGWGDEVCNDEELMSRFRLHRRYADLVFGTATFNSTQFTETHLRYKSLDLNLWHPNIEVPEEYSLPPTENLRVMHAFYKANREKGGKNVKGSPFVLEAVEKLRSEGYAVEYFYVTDVPSRYMRYYQIQADIIVEQLHYGWWGSTGIEAMALGRPVACYLRPAWKEFFLRTFPEYESLPIAEANTETIYDVLEELVINREYREQKGREARLFAERHFDAKKNAPELEKVFLSL